MLVYHVVNMTFLDFQTVLFSTKTNCAHSYKFNSNQLNWWITIQARERVLSKSNKFTLFKIRVDSYIYIFRTNYINCLEEK